VNIDPLELLHNKNGCTSTERLVEDYRQQLITYSELRRTRLTKKTHNKGYRRKQFLCGICARMKVTRKSFGKKATVTSKEYLNRVTSDISVYLNCPSREGYKYMIVFTDEATKQFWSYKLHKRTADAVLMCLHQLYLKELPPDAKIEKFYSDGGGKLITERVKMFLPFKGTRTFPDSSTDTPKLNSVSEINFEHSEKLGLAMLSRSKLPKTSWAKAKHAAGYLLRRLPTNTVRSYTNLMEVVSGGQALTLGYFRVLGCKANVLKIKDWKDKANIGYFT
jgi:hypothetical protein